MCYSLTDLDAILDNIQRLYESVNIYNAVFLYDKWGSNVEALIERLSSNGYPVMNWEPGKEYLYVSRLLFISISDLEDLFVTDENKDTFNLIMTADADIFDNCLKLDACSERLIVQV